MRHKIENRFGKLKNWRRINIRYDRLAHFIRFAIANAAIATYWRSSMSLDP
jgi:hypothetical protein